MKPRSRAAGVAVFLAVLVVVSLARISREESVVGRSAETDEKEDRTLSASPADESPIRSSAAAPSRARSEDREAAFAKIRERFGAELQAEFGADGRLVAIKGRPGRGRRAGLDFRPDDPQKALARAREILEASRALLGIRPDWPLGHPVAKGGQISAQVYFQQAHEGVSVAPFGSVSVDLDSQGGLLRLDSSYVRDPVIVNSQSISAVEAKARAIAAVETSGRAPVEGGDTILWISRPSRSRAEARYAYDYYVQGRQVVVDASSGAILSKRDRRQY